MAFPRAQAQTLFLGLSQAQAKFKLLIFPDEPSLNMHYLTKLGSFTALVASDYYGFKYVAFLSSFRLSNTSIVGDNGMNLQLFFYKLDLWRPSGMGKQSLYNVHITVDVKGYGESDAWSHLFGFRKIESHIDSATSGRYCFICLLGHFT